MSPTPQKDDQETLAMALDHVWRWYELRHGQGIQVINFFMLAVAVLSAGYVSALNAKLYAAAGAVGLLGMIVSVVVFLVSRRLRDVGKIAEEPIAALQDRLATTLNVDSLRMMSLLRATSSPKWWKRTSRLYSVAAMTSVSLGFAAMLYAWLGH
jgi:hypothetical protein